MSRVALFALCALALHAHAAKRALLIGINDYSAAKPLRNLDGPRNDVDALRETLIERYGFEEEDIVTLSDSEATREAILGRLDSLSPPTPGSEAGSGAGSGRSVVLFYFSGHGTRLADALSDERDGMDEAIVAADGREIRDKELRARFNAIVDRGARLTIILDHCFSGSGARSVAPRIQHHTPEQRGALVLSATQDFDRAWETRDDGKHIHGAFSWALVRAMRDASAGASASEVFLRAQARMRAETPFQQPVMSGDARARLTPFLGDATPRSGERTFVFVEKVRHDRSAVVQGGRAHGLSIGSELRADDTILRVTTFISADRSEACIETGNAQPGMMLEVLDPQPLRDLRGPRGEAGLALRSTRGEIASEALIEGEQYELVLRSSSSPRFAYVFAIDSRGESVLLYPHDGSVENRFGSRQEAVLDARFEVAPPFGVETFILLTSDEPLSDPWVLERGETRGPPETWSVVTYVFRSVAAQKRHNRPSSVSEERTSSPNGIRRTLEYSFEHSTGGSRRTRRSTREGHEWRSTSTATMSSSRAARRSIPATLPARSRRTPASTAASSAAKRS